MNHEFRVIIFSKDILQIRRVFLDEMGNPVAIDPEALDLSAESVQELVSTVLHLSACLTKPALDVNMFVKQDVNESARKAAELLKGK